MPLPSWKIENMQAIQWHATNNQFVISIDKSIMEKEDFFNVLRWLRLRFLVQKADFDESIEDVGEEILTEWWEKNQHRFVPSEG